MTKKKTNRKLEADLFSANSVDVVKALEKLKTEGNKEYLPLLFDLLISDPEENIENEIIKILGSLKVKDAAPVMVNALKENKYKPIRKRLLTACWQNGLDYKNHLQTFVDLVIEEDWETGFEAFTVIDNMEKLPGEEIAGPAIDNEMNEIKDAGVQKKYFLHEIVAKLR